jgi:hypothetical protein
LGFGAENWGTARRPGEGTRGTSLN